jgi:hypothetical protein
MHLIYGARTLNMNVYLMDGRISYGWAYILWMGVYLMNRRALYRHILYIQACTLHTNVHLIYKDMHLI